MYQDRQCIVQATDVVIERKDKIFFSAANTFESIQTAQKLVNVLTKDAESGGFGFAKASTQACPGALYLHARKFVCSLIDLHCFLTACCPPHGRVLGIVNVLEDKQELVHVLGPSRRVWIQLSSRLSRGAQVLARTGSSSTGRDVSWANRGLEPLHVVNRRACGAIGDDEGCLLTSGRVQCIDWD
ncbi:hypothetical protein PHYPSEUDO_000817 [Phytophthora pseudosyringae]|uniref:Uncharacterized protein n=1 Tax=Phytophthora pseudosyringae TaxID=221518 RepID=A0A8T1WL13_9STRA|nr:hypothetical protein PHYPSEUDO_000817 [Phytophthora pseudosyringae]